MTKVNRNQPQTKRVDVWRIRHIRKEYETCTKLARESRCSIERESNQCQANALASALFWLEEMSVEEFTGRPGVEIVFQLSKQETMDMLRKYEPTASSVGVTLDVVA